MNIVEQNVPLLMELPILPQVRPLAPPQGFQLRPYRPGDREHWVAIHQAADVHSKVQPSTFDWHFGADEQALTERQLYLEDAHRRVVGTSSAWMGEHEYEGWGRVHWIALLPQLQGQGLGRLLLTATLQRLKDLHHKNAYLWTISSRVPAINMYLSFGFNPKPQDQKQRQAWKALQQHLKYNANCH